MKKQHIHSKGNQIPTIETVDSFSKSGWIAPNGDFYGIDNAAHFVSATYIAVFILNLNPDGLRKGTYFKETFDTHIRTAHGFLEIKDVSWIDPSAPTEVVPPRNVTQKQLDTLFDYDQEHGTDLVSQVTDPDPAAA